MNRKMIIMLVVCGLLTQSLYPGVWEDMAGYQYGDKPNPVKEVEKLLQETPVEKYGRLERHLVDIIESKDATEDAKAFACRFLQRVGTRRCIPAVSALLCKKTLSHYARLVLERLKCEEADRAMLKALKNAPAKLKVGILGSLSERRYKKAVKPACRLARGDNTAVVKAAIRALGEIGGKEAAACLSALKPADKLKPFQMKSLAACAGSLPRTEAVPLLEKMYGKAKDSCAPAALRELLRVAPSKAIPLLTKAIKGRNVKLKRGVLSMVADTKAKRLTKALLNTVKKLPPDTKPDLITAVGMRGDKSAAASIMDYISSKHSGVREAAVKAVAELGDAGTVQRLLGMADSPPLRDTIAEAIANMGDGDIDKALIEALKNKGLRSAAVSAIEARGCTKAVPRLLSLLKEEKTKSKKKAWSVVASLAGEDDLDPIMQATLKLKGEKQLQYAQGAIKSICSRSRQKEKCFHVLTGYYDEAPEPVQRIILEVGATIGSSNALKLERRALESGDGKLYKTALNALAEWPNEAAAEDLLKQAKGASQESHRMTALRGYIRIAAMDNAALTGAERTKMFRKAMALATRPEEKKKIVSGLQNAVTLEALEMLKKYMRNPDLKSEAELSCANLIWNLRTSYPDKAEATAKKLVNSQNRAASRKAIETLADLRKSRSYVRGYLMSEVYKGKDFSDLFKTAFPPEKNGKNVRWRNLTKGIGRETIDLEKAAGSGNQRCVYLKTTLVSPKAQKVRLELGSDDAIKVWLNGALVHKNRVFRGCTPGDDVAEAELTKGENVLLLKVINGSGEWGVSCRLRQENGMPVKNLEVRPE